MNPEHRKIIKKNYLLMTNVDFNKLIPYLLEYKMFNRYMWEDIRSISDVLELLPTRGPEAFHNFIEILRSVGYNTEADYLEGRSLRSDSEPKLFYKMTTKPLGYCLIINNMKFDDPKLEYRKGSDVDANSLQNFFEKADFNVEIKSNLTSRKMLECLRNFSEKDFDNVDSMILIIMSHGGHLNNKDFLYGTDGNPNPPLSGFLYKDDIYRVFDNKNCNALQSKPKIFFFIACRGEAKDYGVAKSQRKESLDSVAIDDTVLPELSDMLIINSSLPNNVTVRHHEKGTYFCQAFVEVLNEWYQIYDLETMIKLVNQKLEGNVSEDFRIVQAVHGEITVWKKKIMLCHKR